MGIHLAVLTTLALSLLCGTGGALAGGGGGCLACHPPHFETRGTCIGCHQGDDRSDRLRIAHRDLIAARFASFQPSNEPSISDAPASAAESAAFCRCFAVRLNRE